MLVNGERVWHGKVGAEVCTMALPAASTNKGRVYLLSGATTCWPHRAVRSPEGTRYVVQQQRMHSERSVGCDCTYVRHIPVHDIQG
jgi:hypothetical protein